MRREAGSGAKFSTVLTSACMAAVRLLKLLDCAGRRIRVWIGTWFGYSREVERWNSHVREFDQKMKSGDVQVS